jgi:tetratricopeptide (TPR) repeat protein
MFRGYIFANSVFATGQVFATFTFKEREVTIYRSRVFPVIFSFLMFVMLSSGTFLGAQTAQTSASAPAPLGIGFNFQAPRSPLSLDGETSTGLPMGALVVVGVQPQSPAAAAGIRGGDVVLAFGSQRLCRAHDPGKALARMAAGSEVPILIYRDGSLQTLQARPVPVSELYPNAARNAEASAKAEAALKAKDYKQLWNICKEFPPGQQIMNVSGGCALAQYYNLREGRSSNFRYGKVDAAMAEAVQSCPRCTFLYASYASAQKILGLGYAGTWGKTVALSNENLRFQLQAFAALDRQAIQSLKAEKDQTASQLLSKYAEFAEREMDCRDIPPTPELADYITQIASQSDASLALPDAAQQRMERAQSESNVYKAVMLWNGVIWQAPWSVDAYSNTAQALDKAGRPAEALEISRRAVASKSVRAVTTASAASANQQTQATAEELAGDPWQLLNRSLQEIASAKNGSADEKRLRERCIRLALRMSPPPEVPESAQRQLSRGQAALKMAQTPEDFADASREFDSALVSAPWWGEAYLSLGDSYQKAGNYQQAIAAYNWYLRAVPAAADAREIRNAIYEMEYAYEREKKQVLQRALVDRERAARVRSLNGTWQNKESGTAYTVAIQDGMFVARNSSGFVIKGVFKENALEGTFITPSSSDGRTGCTTPEVELPMSGTLSESGTSLTVTYQAPYFEWQGIPATLFTVARCTSVNRGADQTSMMVLVKR